MLVEVLTFRDFGVISWVTSYWNILKCYLSDHLISLLKWKYEVWAFFWWVGRPHKRMERGFNDLITFGFTKIYAIHKKWSNISQHKLPRNFYTYLDTTLITESAMTLLKYAHKRCKKNIWTFIPLLRYRLTPKSRPFRIDWINIIHNKLIQST